MIANLLHQSNTPGNNVISLGNEKNTRAMMSSIVKIDLIESFNRVNSTGKSNRTIYDQDIPV